jgi:hypothetical protein
MIQINVDRILRIIEAPDAISMAVVKDLTLPNPEYVQRERLQKWTGNTPYSLSLAYVFKNVFHVPRGYLESLTGRIQAAGLEYKIVDRRLTLPNKKRPVYGAEKRRCETF